MNVSAKRLDIRKYPNRRYYDSTHSRHLTLEEIRSLVQQGYDIKVTDSKSGADITAQVLTQIVLELETPKIQSFPVALLLRLIRTNDQLVRDFLETYFSQAFGAYLEYHRQMEERLRHMQTLPGPFSPLAWTQALLTPLGVEKSDKLSSTQTSTPSDSNRDEVAELRRVIGELQTQVADLRKKRRQKRIRSRS